MGVADQLIPLGRRHIGAHPLGGFYIGTAHGDDFALHSHLESMKGLAGGLAELGLQSLQAVDAAQPVQHPGHASWRAADRAIDPLAGQQDRAPHTGRRRQLLQLIAQFL